MKKVLFTATITKHIEGFHKPFLKRFKEKGWNTYVATGDNADLDEYCDKKIQIELYRSPFNLKNLKGIFQLKKLIDSEKFDIIHCHTPMGAIVTRIAASESRKKNRTKVIYTAHGFHFYKGAKIINWLLFYPIEKIMAKYTDVLITINKEDYLLAKKKLSTRCKRIEYVKGVGVDKEKYNFDFSEEEKNNLKKELGLKVNDFIMIFPARLDKNKNQIFLINVMNMIIKENKNIHLLLPGRDELNGFYQKKVEKLNLSTNIHFLGYRSDIAKLQKISNLSVSSSLREGLPVNVLEATVAKIPVVALKCRGMEDLIENGVNGYLIEIKNKKAENIFKNYILEYVNGKKYKTSKKTQDIEISKIIERMDKIYFE